MSDLAKLAKDLPDLPGVYLWKDDQGKILYIGKAKSLRKRVVSYLRLKGMFRRTWDMMQKAADLETVVTNSEREALLLEATLIKRHQPPYNIRLKDDKVQSWIRVDLTRAIPTFEITREVDEGYTYYGPYGGSKRLERLIDTVRRFIPIGMCKEPEKEKRACMDFHVGRCAGPCTEAISLEDYRLLVDQMTLYLEGQFERLTQLLEEQMELASANLEFERAATLRDRLDDITSVLRKQRIVDMTGINRDVLGISRTEEAALVELLIIRGGRLIAYDNFYIEVSLDVTDTDILRAFIDQYYFTLPRLPDEILIPSEFPEMTQRSEWLSDRIGRKVAIIAPASSDLQELVDMATTNAYRALRKILVMEDQEVAIVHDGVKELREALGMDLAPLHIEGFDIANIQGTDPTGSCVVFRNGRPDNKSYRMFKVRVKESPDDYAMMHEVVFRRYRGVLERGESLPDLVLVDGGKGQLNVALKALEELGLENLEVASLAKREEILYTRELSDGVALEIGSAGLRLVQHIRDEAHRFAQKYHHKLRERRFTGSILEDAPGIGPKRRGALLRAFGSYEMVRQATAEELALVDGMSKKAAEELYAWLRTESVQELL